MKKNKVDSLRHREIRTGYLMIAPLMSGVIVFFIWAFFQNVYYSFTNKSSFGIPKFVGLENYVKLFHDEAFYQAFINTILYVVICVPAVVILAILLAVLLNSKVKGIGFFRVCIFLPAVTLPAAIGLLWKWLMNYKFGIFNEILGKFGVNPIAWLSDPRIVLFSISIVFIWASVAYQVIVLLAGLQGICWSCNAYRRAYNLLSAGHGGRHYCDSSDDSTIFLFPETVRRRNCNHRSKTVVGGIDYG